MARRDDRSAPWRARLVRAVQARLRSLPAGHVLRRAHAALRGLPPVSFIWRKLLNAEGRDWFEPESYRRLGGVFAPDRSGVGQKGAERSALASGLPPEWRCLAEIAAAAKGEPAYVPIGGRVVLVNCSAAAGGAERQLTHTLTGLRARGLDAIFIGEFIQSGDAALDFHLAALTAAGVPVERADPGPLHGPRYYANVGETAAAAVSGLPPDAATRLLGMVDHLRRLRPEVVHLWQDQTSVLHGFAALIAGAPRIVLSGRNVNPTHFGYFQPWLRPGYRVLAAHANVVLSNNSEAGAQSYCDWLELDRARIRVILNGLPPVPRVSPKDRIRARNAWAGCKSADETCADEGLLVAGIFRMSPEKRPLLWIDAAAEIARIAPDARFVIAGDGPLMNAARTHAGLRKIAHRIRFLGEVHDVHCLLGAADVLLLTSRQEGTPNVLLEAQAQDAAVVCIDAGGSAACVIDGVTGLVLQDGDDIAADLAQAVIAAARLSANLRATGAGRAHIERRFSLERMLDETLSAYGLR